MRGVDLTVDVRDWLGLEPTHDPMRWHLPITPKVSVRSRFLFGGGALGAAVAALEATTRRPIVWATAQYLDYAPVGSVMDLDVTVAVAGHNTTQARLIGHVGEKEIVTVNAALGLRQLDLVEQWPTPPTVRPAEECPPRERLGAESLTHHLDQRWAMAPDARLGGPTGHGSGTVCVWTRLPVDIEPSAATLAILGDWVPMGIGTATERSISSNSLDNTIRVLDVRETEWFLLEIRPAGIRNGFGHGDLRIWADDETLMAIASQSTLVRERGRGRDGMPRLPDRPSPSE